MVGIQGVLAQDRDLGHGRLLPDPDFLTFDSMSQITAGTKRVPDYSVINQRIEYVFDDKRNAQVPKIGVEEPLFGQKLTEES
jgi:hypothetical protein